MALWLHRWQGLEEKQTLLVRPAGYPVTGANAGQAKGGWLLSGLSYQTHNNQA